jgi:hypothetical protein
MAMDCFMNPLSRVKQRGQALPLGIAFLMSTLLLVLVLFNTGQSTSERARLLNTADAAAYSGLVWQARALNMQAYTNRAMVANQVSIGQLVSLTSWTQHAYHVARNIDEVATYFPIIKPYTQVAETVTDRMDSAVVDLAEVFIPIIDGINGVLSRMQEIVYAASFAATPGIVAEVVEENDARYRADSAYAVLGLGENGVGWQSFTRRYDDREHLLRKADVINRSKDEFTASRNLGTSQLIPEAPSVLDLVYMRVWVSKEGRTNLIAEEETTGGGGISGLGGTTDFEWKGKDTMSLHIKEFKMTSRGMRWVHREIPLGWGARYLNGDFECEEDEDGDEVCPSYMQQNRMAEWFANSEQAALNATYNGVRAYYDLSSLSSANRDPRLALRIEVELPQAELRTASKIDGLGSDGVPEGELRNGIGEGMFGTEDQMAGGGMAVIASGELFFHPPDDFNPAMRRGRYEVASLFSPYWEVHLVDTSQERQFMAWALRDETLFTEGASGIAEGVERFTNEKEEELQRLHQLQEDLQSQLEETLDEATRSRIEAQLSGVSAQISELESAEIATASVARSLQESIDQGAGWAATAEVAEYEQMLESYGAEQGEELMNAFQDEVVDEVTEQLSESLQRAMDTTVESAMSAFTVQ